MHIPFDNSYTKLPDHFFATQSPANVPSPQLIRRNAALADQLSIDSEWFNSASAIETFAGNEIAAGSEPIAQAYAGHQFGGFSPQLGDGRAILLGEVIDQDGRRKDIQLKGSGRTAFSRGGDGKAALGPVLREYIVSEAMHALGVPTTRALAAVTTGESVFRQEGPLPGAVFTRVAASHIRVGTFQYFLARQETDALKTLADYVIARHYPESAKDESPYRNLLKSVISKQARLIAHWMSLGFIHGVMNTDNCSISGETIDYGPCAFMDAFHPNCVFSSIDSQARYAWGNQGNIGLWNLSRFAETLLPLLSDNTDQAIEIAESELSNYSNQFRADYDQRFRAKLGLPSNASLDVIQDCLELLATHKIDFTLFFRRLTQLASGEPKEPLEELFTDKTALDNWITHWNSSKGGSRLEEMQAANPILIPRNHRIEQAIQSANTGDYSPFHRLVDALGSPFSENEKYSDLELPPRSEEIVHETFCGT